MNRECHLIRVAYDTDAGDDDPTYMGSFSSTMRLPDGWQIVAVDWSKRGEVEVTFLVPGRRE